MYAQRVSALFLKISVFATLLGVVVLLIMPESLYLLLFGKQFVGIKFTICILAVGILFQSAEIILSHYFSGTGQQIKNSISAFIGLIVTLIGGILLIPNFDAIGAAYTSSISYLSMLIYMIICMRNQPQANLSLFLPKNADLLLLKRIIRKKSN